jgi:hypothetical protein
MGAERSNDSEVSKAHDTERRFRLLRVRGVGKKPINRRRQTLRAIPSHQRILLSKILLGKWHARI